MPGLNYSLQRHFKQNELPTMQKTKAYIVTHLAKGCVRTDRLNVPAMDTFSHMFRMCQINLVCLLLGWGAPLSWYEYVRHMWLLYNGR